MLGVQPQIYSRCPSHHVQVRDVAKLEDPAKTRAREADPPMANHGQTATRVKEGNTSCTGVHSYHISREETKRQGTGTEGKEEKEERRMGGTLGLPFLREGGATSHNASLRNQPLRGYLPPTTQPIGGRHNASFCFTISLNE